MTNDGVEPGGSMTPDAEAGTRDVPPSTPTRDAGRGTRDDAYGDAVRGLPAEPLARPLALVGFMGVGKTTVARLVAQELGWAAVDTDERVEMRSNMTVREIFDWFGEPRFRDLEHEAIAAEVGRGRSVLSLGGGAFISAANRDLLLESCTVAYLAAPWPHLAVAMDRLRHTRPLLRGRSLSDLRALFDSRHPTYDRAHLRVGVAGRPPDEIARRLLEMLSAGGM
ncbi:MAG: shikimate kinase [Chloroflexota bacterium]